MKELKKKNIVRKISSCITEKYNGFQTISIEFARRDRKKFKPIGIIYKPKIPQKLFGFAILHKTFQKQIQFFTA